MPALPTSNEGRGGSSGVAKHLTFFNVFVATFSILALKERWEEYQANRQQRKAATTAVDAEAAAGLLAGVNPPPYRDEPDASDDDPIRLLSGNPDSRAPSIIPEARQPYRRKKGCCVCCGLNCSMFCKALGIAVLLFTVYYVFVFVRWVATPDPDGTEGMPEFSSSVQCPSAQFIFGPDHDQNGVTYAVPAPKGILSLDISGAATGSLLVSHNSEIEEPKISLLARADVEDSLSKFVVDVSSGTWVLRTPLVSAACMDFAMHLQLPTELENLTIVSRSLTQVKFTSDGKPMDLVSLNVLLASQDHRTLLLPSSAFTVSDMDLSVRGGYIVGDAAFRNIALVSTRRGDANTKLSLITRDEVFGSEQAPRLVTETGDGIATFHYQNAAHRHIDARHSSTGGKLYLRYAGTGFSGPLDVTATGWSNSGHVENLGLHNPSGSPYVGDVEGIDKLVISTPGSIKTWF